MIQKSECNQLNEKQKIDSSFPHVSGGEISVKVQSFHGCTVNSYGHRERERECHCNVLPCKIKTIHGSMRS